MPNPLLDVFGKPAPAAPKNPMQMVQAFQQFKKQFTGDPKAAVEQLLSSGRMSQAQFQQLSAIANQFGSLFK